MSERGTIRGRHVLIMVLAFFGVVIFANGVFVTFALKSFPGETEKKSYLQGLHYNEVLARRAEQETLGWKAAVSKAERDGEAGVIELVLVDAANRPLDNLYLEGELKRPASDKSDHSLLFAPSGDGAYEAQISPFLPGVWELAVRVNNNAGDQFDITARLIVE